MNSDACLQTLSTHTHTNTHTHTPQNTPDQKKKGEKDERTQTAEAAPAISPVQTNHSG
jgi:hypothetical protein